MSAGHRLVLLLAEGLGSGRMPIAPGTFGSVVGLGWFLLLLAPGSPAVFVLGCAASLVASIPICTRAETLLNRHDPGSIVIDEIVAMPVCFAGLLLTAGLGGSFPTATSWIANRPWTLVAGFVAFRVFDILKPWPARQAQKLPRGLGVVADDILAAIWVNVLLVPLFA